MPDADYTHLVFLLDRTGSMEVIRHDTIGGFNAFLAQQQKLPGRCTFTLVQFDGQDPQEFVQDTVPIGAAAPLTEATFVPRGNTPLLDALGRLILGTGARLAALPEPARPGRVIFVVLTDGEENASEEYSRDRVFQMIQHQREAYRWQFVFLGANQDAIGEAVRLGIDDKKAMTFAASPEGVEDVRFCSVRLVSDLRTHDLETIEELGFTDEERARSKRALR